MARQEDDESDEDIEDDIFRFFEFFFVTSRDQDEPSCIDDEDHTENREKGIKVVDQIPDDTDPSLEILSFDRTATRPEKTTFFTVWTAIDHGDKSLRQFDEEKSDDRIDDDIFPFFELLLISPSCHDHIECIDHHPEESEPRENLEESNNRRKYIYPDLPTCHRADPSTRIREEERIPGGKCYLHDEYPDRYPDDVGSPLLRRLFIS